MALDLLTVEPGDCTAAKADHRWLLLIHQHLHLGKVGGVIHCDMQLVASDAIGAPLLPGAVPPVPHLVEPGQGLDVDVDQISWRLPLVALNRRFGLQVSQPPKPESVKCPCDGREGSLQHPG